MIQLQVINKIIQTGDPSFFILNNLNKDYFSDYPEQFTYIKEHYDQYGNVPDPESFLNKFPDFEYITVNESDKYLIDSLFEDKQKRDLARIFNNVRTSLMNDDIDGALKLFTTAAQEMGEAVHLDAVDIFKDFSRYDDYVDRIQNLNNYYVTTGFIELDEVLGGWDRQEEYATIVARSNQGKCLAKGTKVLMSDGTFKNVENIVVGDYVQSDHKVNKVLALHNGKSNGWRIIPSRYTGGKEFTVSADHILTLAKYNDNTKSYEPNLYDIKVEDYLSLNKKEQSKYRLYRPEIEYPEKDLKIPPYLLGTWLGDGTASRVEICCPDEEIKNVWSKWVSNYNLICSSRKGYSYEITAGTNKVNNNPVIDIFREYNLLNNKHIPLEYLTSSREQRLELLAGLIDTDGYYREDVLGQTFEIIQKSKAISEGIQHLCMSLGFACTVREKYSKFNGQTYGPYDNIRIKGDTYLIPTKLTRKQAKPRNTWHAPDSRYATFKIEPVAEVEYYGFRCSGDERYMLSDGTLTHNTWILLKTALAAAEAGLNVGIYSGEMSVNKVGYRVDTLLGHISNTGITKGNQLVLNDYKRYIETLKAGRIKGSIKILTPEMISGPAGVTALRAFIKKEKLDMLCIDQHSLLEDDRKAKNPVEKAANISRDIKNLQVMERIPIITVSQQNRESTEESGITLAHIAQSDRIGQDSTTVISFEQKDGKLTLQIIKSRDSAVGKKLEYAVNFDKGTFEYMPAENDAKGGTDCENLRAAYDMGSAAFTV